MGAYEQQQAGSPPPMRGKVRPFAACRISGGITPAYAGKSWTAGSDRPLPRDHPRLCGEKVRNSQKLREFTGSPPPMRGKVTISGRSIESIRITPAYAGKSLEIADKKIGGKDHPRLCGEKVQIQGKRTRKVRITPAYAGKRDTTFTEIRRIWDHPRLCGEKIVSNGRSIDALGSPPPMRGKVGDYRTPYRIDRITPAYAGKSYLLAVEHGYSGDHPRLCGEKSSTYCRSYSVGGSPPPMRGKGKAERTLMGRDGITPAYAGKSSGTEWSVRTDWDHPRLCGEKHQIIRVLFLPVGSPPPMRGKEEKVGKQATRRRITPAYAGKSRRQLPRSCTVQDHPRLCGEKCGENI